MTANIEICSPGTNERNVRSESGEIRRVPDDWTLVPPGDPALTRRIKAIGPAWVVQEKRGRKIFGRGLWAPLALVESIRAELVEERADPAYAKKRASDSARRERKHQEYVGDFRTTVLAFLAFHPDHATVADRLADAVTSHATPVGSGTVARTERIPIEERAEAAVIAWMRHQTTAYDTMHIARIKGERREVRRMLAQRSRQVLEAYRRGQPISPDCPLWKALQQGG